MKIYVKYITLLFAFGVGCYSFHPVNIGTGITAAGAFICYV